MSEQKERKHFERQRNRFQPAPRTRGQPTEHEAESSQSSEIRSSQASSIKHEVKQEEPAALQVHTIAEKVTWNFSAQGQEALRRIISVTKDDYYNLLKDKAFRQGMRKQQTRLTKIRKDQKLTDQTDTELSSLAIGNLLTVSQQIINALKKQTEPKEVKPTAKSIVRINQEKEMSKLVTSIDEHLTNSNYLEAKSHIANLVKRFGKDDFIQDRIESLSKIQNVIELYEKQVNLTRQTSKYLQKLSSINIESPQYTLQSNTMLKNIRKELTIVINKQKKKTDPSQAFESTMTQIEKISAVLLSFTEPKPQKKLIKKQSSVSSLELKGVGQVNQFLEEAARYCNELLQKTAQDRPMLLKQLQILRKNKKKSGQSPYKLVLRLLDIITEQKKEINDVNFYLKGVSQLYLKKTLSNEVLLTESQKLSEKYNSELLSQLKQNLDGLIATVQQKERSGKEINSLQQEIKKLKAQNQRLTRQISDPRSKTVEKSPEEPRVDRKKQMEEKRLRQAERLKAQRLEKDIDKGLESIYSNLSEKKWKFAKNAINAFVKKFEQASNPIIPSTIRNLSAISAIITQIEAQQVRFLELQKREKSNVKDSEKQKQQLNDKIRSHQEYEAYLKDLLQNYSQEKYPMKKVFQDLRRDRKKIVQERYLLLNKLQQPLNLWRAKNLKERSEEETKNINLTFSSASGNLSERTKKEKNQFEDKFKQLQAKSAALNKDVEQLLNLIKRIEKGGQWWKFIPKNLKNNAVFKPVYSILQQYRKYELNIQALQANTSIIKQEQKSIENAIDLTTNILSKQQSGFAEGFWQKKLALFKGKPVCDKFVTCLKSLTAKLTAAINQEGQKYKVELERMNNIITNLERNLSDRQRSSQLEESAKKSVDLRSSRRSSRSRDKKQEKSKELVESYIQDERNYLNKIDQVEKEKLHMSEEIVSLQLKAQAIQQELIKSEQKLLQLEKVKMQLEKDKYRQFNQINNLKGELEISEGRIHQVQTRLESQVAYFKELSDKVSSRVAQETFKAKELQAQNQALKTSLQRYKVTSESTHSHIQQASQESTPQKVEGRAPRFDFELDLGSSKVVDFIDTKPKTSRRRPRQELQHQQVKQEQPEEASWQTKVSQLAKEVSLLKERLEYEISESTKLQLIITDLTTENNQLKITLQNVRLNDKTIELNKEVQRLQEANQRLQINLQTFNQAKARQIQEEVRLAIEREVNQFNSFLAKDKEERENYYLNEVLPQRIQEEIQKYKASQIPSKTIAIDIDSAEFQALDRQRYEAVYEQIKTRFDQKLQESMKAYIEHDVPLIVEQKKEEWKIQQIEQSQQLIQNLKKQWQAQMRQEWTTKEVAIQQYWSQLLSRKEQQWQIKSQLLSRRQPSPVKQEPNLTDDQLLQLLRSQKHKAVASTLLAQRALQWERHKEVQWQSRERQITAYWQNSVLPKLKIEWEEAKRQQAVVSNKANEEDLIEQWKSMFLGSIVEYERNSAINYFIQHQLPNILHQEHTRWVEETFEKSKLEKQTLLRQQWQLWNKTKKEEFDKQTQHFQSRLKQIEISYQNQLIEWQEKLFKEQQRSASAEALLKSQRQKWSQQRVQLQRVIAKPEVQQNYQALLASERNTIDQLKYTLLNLESQLNQQRTQTYYHSERERELAEKIADMERSFSSRIQIECQSILKDNSMATSQLVEQARKQVELQWSSRYEKLRQQLNQQAQVFNQQIINLRGEWQRQKQEQIAQTMNSEIQRWEKNKAQEISHIMTNERQIWQRQRDEEITLIISSQRNKWTKEQEVKSSSASSLSQEQIMQKIETECQHRLVSARNEWKQQKQIEWNRWIELERQSWEQLKAVETEQKIKEVQLHWELHILREKEQQWKNNEQIVINQIVNQRIAQIEKEFHEVRIPEILQRQYQLWVEESNQNIQAERQRWLSSIPELIKGQKYRIYVEPLINAQTSHLEGTIRLLQTDISHYQTQVRELEIHHLNSENRIKQLVAQLSEEKLKVQQSVKQKRTMEEELNKIISEQQMASKQTVIETHRINEELTRSKWMEAETNQLKKVIDKQKQEISSLNSLSRENQMLKRENLSLKENNIAIENSKWAEISKLKESLELQILELSNERNTLLSRITEIETTKHQSVDKQAILSFERQIATLLATIKTKDAEISFLKRSIDSHKEELKEARDQYSEAMEQKIVVQRQLAEIKNSKMELEYQLKYMSEREESLKKKIQSKQQEIISYKKKETLQVSSIQIKTKTSMETLASYQARFGEIESMLSLKTQECQSKAIEVDRLRYDVQRNEATIHSANLQIQSLRTHLKGSQSHFSNLKIEYERNQQELARTKLSLSQCLLRQQDANKQINSHIRAIKHEESEKLRLEVEVQRLNDQINKLWRDLNQSQKAVRIQAERSVQLEREIRQLREGETSQIDHTELHMLTKINNEVSELTATNRQLTMKIVLLQNQQRVMAFSPDVLKFFLLVQKHTDLLVEHLLRENIIPSLEFYQQFLSESRPYLASGEIAVFFAKWEIMIRQLFQQCIRSRAEEMRTQAEQLLRLKQEMNEILEKQIEASEHESGQLVEDYKSVLVDIKSLVREYMHSGDREYLNLLCSSLGITQR